MSPEFIAYALLSVGSFAVGFISACRVLRAKPEDNTTLAVIRYEWNNPDKPNEMPQVVSCSHMPDGEYAVRLVRQP